ncbi:MAG: YciI family protein [Bryobacteraceae bacterium]|jgi:hypothetical protein
MQRYLLLLRGEPRKFAALSPEEIQGILAHFAKWREELAAAGRNPQGQKLRDGVGRQLKQAGGKLVVTDGPYAETREIIGGYYAFDAESLDQAVELAKGCPVLPFGPIEIREIETM